MMIKLKTFQFKTNFLSSLSFLSFKSINVNKCKSKRERERECCLFLYFGLCDNPKLSKKYKKKPVRKEEEDWRWWWWKKKKSFNTKLQAKEKYFNCFLISIKLITKEMKTKYLLQKIIILKIIKLYFNLLIITVNCKHYLLSKLIKMFMITDWISKSSCEQQMLDKKRKKNKKI